PLAGDTEVEREDGQQRVPAMLCLLRVWRLRVDQREQRYVFATRAQLPRHFKSDHAPYGPPTQHVRSTGMKVEQRFRVIRSHRLNLCVRHETRLEPARLHTIERLISTEVSHQLRVTPDLFAARMQCEERRQRSFRLHWNDHG